MYKNTLQKNIKQTKHSCQQKSIYTGDNLPTNECNHILLYCSLAKIGRCSKKKPPGIMSCLGTVGYLEQDSHLKIFKLYSIKEVHQCGCLLNIEDTNEQKTMYTYTVCISPKTSYKT